MSTVPSTTNTPANTAAAKTAAAQRGLNANYQDFLKLLTTELNNQDPTAPMDPTQMVAQIASLSQVEQQINSNTLLQQIVANMTSSQTGNAVSYIGRQIDATGNQFQLIGGEGVLNYTLPAGVAKATVTITDSTGKTVFSGPGTTVAGRNIEGWGGLNSQGTQSPDGVYNFTVTAQDAAGKAITGISTLTTGVVTSVDTADGVSTLALGKISVPIGNVTSVYNPRTTTVQNPPAMGSDS